MKFLFFLSFIMVSNFSISAPISIDKIVVTVNSEPILQSDINSLMLKLNKPGLIDDSILGPFTLKDLKINKKAQLSYLINERILSSEIKRLGLTVTAERVEQEINATAKKAGVSKDELLSAIKSQGLSIAEYREFLKEKIEKQSLVQQEVISKIRISEDDLLNEYLKSTQKKSVQVSEYSLSHIFFNPSKKSEFSAMDRATKAHQQLVSGLSFETAVEQFTEDPKFENNGFLGNFKAGEFLPEIEKLILTMTNGDYTKPIKTNNGVHIFKLLTKKVISDNQFEKEKDRMTSVLLERAFRIQFPVWIESKRSEAHIIYYEK